MCGPDWERTHQGASRMNYLKNALKIRALPTNFLRLPSEVSNIRFEFVIIRM